MLWASEMRGVDPSDRRKGNFILGWPFHSEMQFVLSNKEGGATEGGLCLPCRIAELAGRGPGQEQQAGRPGLKSRLRLRIVSFGMQHF